MLCPILRIPLHLYGAPRCDNTPSIDRIDNSKGYIKGNVQIISWKANRMKAEATLQDLEAMVAYMKRNNESLPRSCQGISGT